jgi:hypothetical protein
MLKCELLLLPTDSFIFHAPARKISNNTTRHAGQLSFDTIFF